MVCTPKQCDDKFAPVKKDIHTNKVLIVGEDGFSGVFGCVSKMQKTKMSKIGFFSTLVAVCSILAIFIVFAMGSFAQEKELRANNTTAIVKENKEIEALDKRMCQMSETISQIRETQIEVVDNQQSILNHQIKPAALLKAIKEAVREGIKSKPTEKIEGEVK